MKEGRAQLSERKGAQAPAADDGALAGLPLVKLPATHTPQALAIVLSGDVGLHDRRWTARTARCERTDFIDSRRCISTATSDMPGTAGVRLRSSRTGRLPVPATSAISVFRRSFVSGWDDIGSGTLLLKKVDSIELAGHEPGNAAPEPRDKLVERLFNEHNESLLRFLRVRLRSDEEAREVAQEAYVRLLQLENPEAVSYFRAFLFKTATNIAIDRLRRDTLDQKRVRLTFFEQAAPSAEHTETQRDLLRKIGDCLEELPPKCRKAFLLSRIHGLGSVDIAAQMRLSPRMIRMYLVRAALHCQECLGGDDGGHDED